MISYLIFLNDSFTKLIKEIMWISLVVFSITISIFADNAAAYCMQGSLHSEITGLYFFLSILNKYHDN